MKSLIAASLLVVSDATFEETSLMQGLVARRGQMSPEGPSRQEATAKLMETATNMMKNGATPDVVNFIEATIHEINDKVLSEIVEDHHEDQTRIYNAHGAIQDAVTLMEQCVASVGTQHSDRQDASTAHKLCRSEEAISCARSRKCESELEELWSHVKIREQEMRRIHWEIHGEWCVGPDDPHPNLADPFHWTESDYWEGDETSQSEHPYPAVDLTGEVIEFRRFSIDRFGAYIQQKPLVEAAWSAYNVKLLECAALEETWTLKVTECDDKQDTLHTAACEHANGGRGCALSDTQYQWSLNYYNNLVETVKPKEQDRKREWETLHIVTCLLETVYTHVIHAIDSGEPCPTTESHPEETAAEINYCHVVEESMSANLTIIYPDPPEPPEMPPVVEPPCTPQYIWEETGSFGLELESSYRGTIEAEGLGDWFTVLSAFGWAGCAAPKACVECEAHELVLDSQYAGGEQCKPHQAHLQPGQMDWDSFRCLSGDQCIDAAHRCNDEENPDCADGSDELGCDNAWGDAILGAQVCQSPIVPDVQFECTSGQCIDARAVCNGVNNCDDGSDEQACATASLTIEAMTGYQATVEAAASVAGAVFHDREYTFESLGSFTGHTFIKIHNSDKNIHDTHVQMKLRLQRPTTLYVSKLNDDHLPWLEAEGWTRTHLEGVSYSGMSRETKTTDWLTRSTFNIEAQAWQSQGELEMETYGPGEVWQKTFVSGPVEMRGDGGDYDHSYVMFAAHPDNQPQPRNTLPGFAEYVGCFRDDGQRDLGTADPSPTHRWTNAETNTFELCRARCGNSLYMSLQWGGECFCADSYGNGAQYHQVDDSECLTQDVSHREPCAPNSYACGGNWANAVYHINEPRECTRSLLGGGIHTDGLPDSANSIQFIDIGAGAAPVAGQIESVSYRIARANQAGLKFQVYRPAGGNDFDLIMESDALDTSGSTGDTRSIQLATPLDFQAGDYIGWVHTGQGTFNFRNSGGNVRWKYGIAAVGSRVNFNGQGPRVYSYEANVAMCGHQD